MKSWLDGLGYADYALTTASEDASFRRYFRLTQGDQSWIVMDAPPEKEPCDEFVRVATMLRAAELNAPEIIHENHDDGFLLLSDFGDINYLQVLNEANANALYGDAIDAIMQMQTCIDADELPLYDEELLRREMELFREWFLEKLLNIELTPSQQGLWQSVTDTLVQSALEQPQVFVHRDYHSRNLMKLNEGNPGILDFQDAVKGPVTYDLVSLLRDCYVAWPEPRVDRWVLDFHELAAQERLKGVKASQLLRWFNLMGAQRHLKAIGIFSRLKLRDGKNNFVHDIPRTLNYLKTVGVNEMSMVGLYKLIDELNLELRAASLGG